MILPFSRLKFVESKKGISVIMVKKFLIILEYNKIINLIETYCNTFIGKDLLKNLLPSSNKDAVKSMLEETFEATTLLYRKGGVPISEINSEADIEVKYIESNNFLGAKALLDIANILKTSRKLFLYLYSDESFNLSEFSKMEDLFSLLYSNENVEKKIFSSIIDEDTIADDASKVLSSLRRTRKNLEQGVREKLSNMIHSSSYSKYLMEPIVTIRNDRFVVPVKEEYKDNISGAILDVSASGSTVYIEPSSVFELNNKINRIKADEAVEIEKILKNLSLMLFPIARNIRVSLNTIGKIDLIFAKAQYSKNINGICPKINDEKQIFLYGARHPLIDKNVVVPIDVSIGKDYSVLLITGPNTGGKTVCLKTVGLFCLMASSGILIPANEGSSIHVFDNVFADIGDEQSIQESLSTFSAHILNIKDILDLATSESLILVDELGSGTDPSEGAGLAISILETFYKRGATVICTTHYPELKKYALTHDGFENASSDFDVENLRPTYKLLLGIPGKSNAFSISKKLGISSDILDRAQSFIKQDDQNIETLLKNIYDDKLEIEKEKENIRKNSNQIELLRKSLERDNSKKEQEANNIISDAKIKARNILLDAKDEANEIIKELNSMTEKDNLANANEARNKLNSSINKLSQLEKQDTKKNLSPEEIQIGMEVFYTKFNSKATVIELPNSSNEVTIQVGSLTMKAKINDLLACTQTSGSANSSASLHNSGTSNIKKSEWNNSGNNLNTGKGSSVSFSNTKAQNVSSEINVIGLNVDEAIPLVDKYLDDCYMANLETARIVHGKGTGKLRDGIHKFLKKNPRVKSFRMGTYGEGEMGVTVVTLK